MHSAKSMSDQSSRRSAAAEPRCAAPVTLESAWAARTSAALICSRSSLLNIRVLQEPSAEFLGHHQPDTISSFSMLMAWVPPRSNNRPVARTYLPAYGSKRRRSNAVRSEEHTSELQSPYDLV